MAVVTTTDPSPTYRIDMLWRDERYRGGFIQAVTMIVVMLVAAWLVSNVVNNLPAYLLVEPLADTPLRTAALLIGVNAGPLIIPWASLATLLWHDRLRKMNVLISWRGFALYGMIVAPVTLVAAVALLALTARVA